MTLQVITANRLIDGAVVYFTADEEWSTWIADASVLVDEQSAEASLALARASVADNVVVDPYLIDVMQEAATIKPIRYREAIRAKGPSTHPQDDRIHPEQDPVERIPFGAVAAGTGVAMAFLNGV